MSDAANEAANGSRPEQASSLPSNGERMPHTRNTLCSLMCTLAPRHQSLTCHVHLPTQVPRSLYRRLASYRRNSAASDCGR
jgi:hypothetical protein